MNASRIARVALPLFLLLVLLTALPAQAQLAPYWVPEPGCYLDMAHDGGMLQTYWGSESMKLVSTQDFMAITSQNHQYDDEGDLILTLSSTVDPSIDDGGYYVTMNPPLKVLDYPLTTGKTWTSTSVSNSSSSFSLPRTNIVTYTVVGPRTVDTVLGQLDVIEVERSWLVTDLWTTDRTMYLHEKLGDVFGLVSQNGCTVVPVQNMTWDGLKAQYR